MCVLGANESLIAILARGWCEGARREGWGDWGQGCGEREEPYDGVETWSGE